MNKKSIIRNISTVLAKPLWMFSLFLCFMLFAGCSTIQSYQMLCLTNRDGNFCEVKRDDWSTTEKSPHFGKWRPPLYEFSFKNKDKLIVYPVYTYTTSFDGPLFLPIVPSPQILCHPEKNNILRLVYSGDPVDIRIEMVDDKLVDPETVEKTKTVGETITIGGMRFYRETLISLKLDESVVSDGKLTVKLSCRDEQKTLEFVEENFKMFVPFIFPASSAP